MPEGRYNVLPLVPERQLRNIGNQDLVKTIRVRQQVSASPERLWWACTDPSGLRCWQADEVAGRVRTGAHLVMSWPKLQVSVDLEVVTVNAPHYVKFRRADAELELEFDRNVVSLRHTGDFSDDEAAGTESAWRLSLATLAHYLARHDAKYRHTHWAARTALTTQSEAHAFFTMPEALCSWLARTCTPIGEAGSEFEIELAWGGRMSGVVLAHTPERDVLLSWREQDDSLLALRTLPSPRSDHERMIVATWSRWFDSPDATTLAGEIDGAVARLCRLLSSTGRA